jgi:hypothetical protein
MKTTDFIDQAPSVTTEDMAIHRDHEVKMAREECYHIASNAIELHKLLEHISETQGIDGWVAEKITLANDYCRTVREYLEYDLMSKQSPGMMEDASACATGSASIAAAPAAPLFKKKKVIKRKMS